MLFCKQATKAIATLLLPLGLALADATRVRASLFNVSPVKVFLSSKTKSGLLNIRNDSAEKMRFELSVYSWGQNPRGEMVLTPTKDIVFYPTLLSLEPGEERKVRIGILTPAIFSEETYRIFVEELPFAQKVQGQHIHILTRLGIPIFVQPEKQTTDTHIEGMKIQQRKFFFNARNKGNVHFLVQSLRIKGIGAEGGVLLEEEVPGWYVLAGSHRAYELDLSKACDQIEILTLNLQTERGSVSQKFAVPPGACSE
jgi:fimbrial chaperone protein